MPASSAIIHLQYIFVLLVVSTGCSVGKSSYYNQYEKKYMGGSSRNNSITIYPDVKAIKTQSTAGIYTVTIEHVSSMGSICKLDTLEVIRYAIRTAKYLVKGMNYKNHYRYIDVIYDSNDDRGVNEISTISVRELIRCYYKIRMPVDDVYDAKILRSNNEFNSVDFKRSSW